jgi:hypothetical protein
MQTTVSKSTSLRHAAAGAPSRPSARLAKAKLFVPRFKWPGGEDAKPVPDNEPLLAPGDEPQNLRQKGEKGLHGAYDTPVVDYKDAAKASAAQGSRQQQQQRQPGPIPDNEVLLTPADKVQASGGKGMQGASRDFGLPVTDYASKASSTSSQPITTGSAADYTTQGYSNTYDLDVQEYYDRLWARLRDIWDNTQDKPQLALYSGVAILTLWLSSRLVDAVESVPLLPGTFKFVGLVYTTNFFYKYVLFASGRERLRGEIDSMINNIESRREELKAAASETVNDEQAKAQRRAAAGPAELRRQAASATNSSDNNGSNEALEAAVKSDVGTPTQTQPAKPARLPDAGTVGGIAKAKAGEGASVADVE